MLHYNRSNVDLINNHTVDFVTTGGVDLHNGTLYNEEFATLSFSPPGEFSTKLVGNIYNQGGFISITSFDLYGNFTQIGDDGM